ncbi:MAG: dehypoxanthine futalosine cyclase [Bryobacterales bacterium]|nr:dehypoxanthine futalosine cyclase [Bryobacterales bacterium]
MMTNRQARDWFESDDLIGLGMEADALRERLHPDGIASYIIDRNINHTNECTEYCSFCAFYRPMGHSEGYVLPFETIAQKIQETVDVGGTGVLMQGGVNPNLDIAYFEDLFSRLKQRFPDVQLHCLSAPEILTIAEVSDLSLRDTLTRLRDSGMDSMPGAGAEILDNDVRRRIARLKCTAEEWVEVHRTAHSIGMRTTSTMMFGCGESVEHRIAHLETLRRLQDETGGFTAFIPWPFQPENTALGRKVREEATACDFLRTLAISRLYLHNILNVQTSWVTQGLKVCQLGLRFGGNDVGSVMLEENVVRQAGASHTATEEDLRRMIREAGFIPKQRDTLYRTYYLN